MNKTVISLLLVVSLGICRAQTPVVLPANIGSVVETSTYIIKHRPATSAIDSLLSTLPRLTLADAEKAVDSTMDQRLVSRIVDAIYMINNMKDGHSLETSRDAISFTTLFPFRRPNNLDIAKLEDIFNSGNATLHKTYLNKFKFTFQNCGAMPELMGLRGIIERNVADCPEKVSALALFDAYAPLQTGLPAPQFELVDNEGNTHRFADYKGKTVVVDVWATWCHNCLKKMADMLKLRDIYAQEGKVVFLAVSIDRRDKRQLWENMSARYGLQGKHNLIVDSDGKSEFENTYKIYGIPRYIVIAPDGSIAEAFAPGPGDDLKKLIDSTL